MLWSGLGVYVLGFAWNGVIDADEAGDPADTALHELIRSPAERLGCC